MCQIKYPMSKKNVQLTQFTALIFGLRIVTASQSGHVYKMPILRTWYLLEFILSRNVIHFGSVSMMSISLSDLSISSESQCVIQLIWCPALSVTSADGQGWADIYPSLSSHWSPESLMPSHWLFTIYSSSLMTDRPGHMGLHNWGSELLSRIVMGSLN